MEPTRAKSYLWETETLKITFLLHNYNSNYTQRVHTTNFQIMKTKRASRPIVAMRQGRNTKPIIAKQTREQERITVGSVVPK